MLDQVYIFALSIIEIGLMFLYLFSRVYIMMTMMKILDSSFEDIFPLSVYYVTSFEIRFPPSDKFSFLYCLL